MSLVLSFEDLLFPIRLGSLFGIFKHEICVSLHLGVQHVAIVMLMCIIWISCLAFIIIIPCPVPHLPKQQLILTLSFAVEVKWWV